MSDLKLVLCSSSPARKTLLDSLKLNFETVSPDVDETPHENETPPHMVERLAQAKALKFKDQFKDSILIGSDITLVCDGTLLGKPLSEENAIKQLQFMSGKIIESYTGLCVHNTKTNTTQTIVEPFKVHMKNYDLSTIQNYLAKEQPLHCAGTLKVEGLGIVLIERLEGDDLNALIGLPLIKLISLLRQSNIDVLTQ